MENANLYVELSRRFSKNSMLADILREHEDYFSWGPEEVVLDAGCGPGDVTADVLLPWLPTDCQGILGVDISSTMVDYADSHYGGGKMKFTEMDLCADLSELNISCGFDKIFSFYALHWLRDMRKGLDNLHSLLAPGGKGLFAFHFDHSYFKTYIRVSAKEPWRKFFKDVKRKLGSFPSEADPGKEFKRLLLSSRFEVEKCEVSKKCLLFESMDVLYGLVEVLDIHVDRIPGHLRRQYINECVQDLKDLGFLRLEKDQILIQQSFLVAIVHKFS